MTQWLINEVRALTDVADEPQSRIARNSIRLFQCSKTPSLFAHLCNTGAP